MGRLVAISSGSMESVRSLHRYGLGLITVSSRNVLFVGTASGDDGGYIESFTEEFSRHGCQVRALTLTRKAYSEEELSDLLSWADLIYVGGGDTIRMMRLWKQYHLDFRLKEIYRTDSAVLMGISAGAICWFTCGCTDSSLATIPPGASVGWAEGMLDLHQGAYCPHYENRVADFALLMAGKEIPGFAMESNTALVVQNNVFRFLKSTPEAKAYRLTHGNGEPEREELQADLE